MVVQHNLAALNTNRMLGITTGKKAKSSEKLASGYRINRAADDAAGLQISEKMRKQVRGLNQGARNTQDGISFVQVGDGAMHEIHDMLQRLTELSVQAANGTNSDEDRLALDMEMQEIKREINRIGNNTVFNETHVFDNNSVQISLEGVPTDLEIFNATYSDTGVLKSFGGFVFHGERVPWTDIHPNMVTVDANGKETFVGGEYSYTSKDTTYSFAFRCKDGDELPLVTREISIEADKDGIVLGKERFDWSQVYDINGNTLSENNLHSGPWAVEYYGAKLVFTVPEPVVDMEYLAENVNSKKSTTVYYDWEGTYGDRFASEQAVDVLTTDILDDVTYGGVNYNRVSQETVDNMYSADEGIRFTVRADDTGVWIENDQDIPLANSKKLWEDLGILSWNDGMTTPTYKDGVEVLSYTYNDGTTDLNFTFDLSNITNKESVITGLNEMQLYQTPVDTTYKATATLSAAYPAVTDVDFSDDTVALQFNEEYTAERKFNTENWVMQDLTASYSDAGKKLTLTYDGGKYAMSGQLTYLTSQTSSAVENYMWWVEKEKINALINGTGTSNINVAGYKADGWGTVKDIDVTMKSATGEEIALTYKYDFQYILGSAGVESQIEASFKDADLQNISDQWLWDEPLNEYDAYYVAKGDGTYITTKDLYEQKSAENRSTISATYEPKILAIQNNASLSAEEKTKQIGELKAQMESDISAANSASKNAIRSDRILDLQVKYGGYINSTTYPSKIYLQNNAIDILQPMAGDQIAAATTIDLTAQTYSKMGDLIGDENANSVNRPLYNSYLKETPVEPDIWIHHSGEVYDHTGIPRFAMNTVLMGLTFANLKTQESAIETIDKITGALKYVSEKRSYYGALQNRLEHTINNLKNVSENTTAAESRIRDTDMAEEMVEYSINSVLAQAGQTMLAQANQLNQGVLSLLQ